MGTSLIGKAVVFGPKEYGFDSRVSKLFRYNSFSYVVNMVNLTISRKEGKTKLVLTRKTYPLIKLLHKLGCINRFIVLGNIGKNPNIKYIVLNALFYKGVPFFRGLRLVSTPSKKHTITLKALHVVNTHLKASTLILSTPLGLMGHREALSLKTGGFIVAILS